jgi:hypothetical protein
MGKSFVVILLLITLFSCSNNNVVSWAPHSLTDSSDVVITCDATEGNRGLYNFKGPVYVHVGVITDMSEKPEIWQYVKFNWGTHLTEAMAKPAGENQWNYTIHNIRKFFDVPDDEKILRLAILFRSECKDTCLALRNRDGSDIFIPVKNIDKEQ